MDAVRSLPPGITAQLLDLPGAVDLRPESTGARDFYDTASIIAGLDLVISVDTSVAHLTGAMGRPVWVLIPHLSDWRWVSPENDNPWYPSARLFRQSSPGDWGGVVERVKAALAG
jgi:ADP-heptose:LPS heptosyltransferase